LRRQERSRSSLFYRFYCEKFDSAGEFGFTGMTHRAQQPFTQGLFDGDENVIVLPRPARFKLSFCQTVRSLFNR
jgi:hypothetical protein